jgi:hypothetical protein
LRAYGDEFDVDAFLNGCTLPVCAVKRRGEPVFPSTQPNGRRHERSGVNVTVSDADFEDFERQVAESIVFLQANAEQVRRLCAWPRVDGVELDFGIERRDVIAQSDEFPAALVRLAGLHGIGPALSQYPVSDEEHDT